MNERDWLASEDPAAMVEWLQRCPLSDDVPAAHPPSDRKLRLWVEACREAEGGLRGGPLYGGPGSGWDLDTPGGLRGAVEAWRAPSADGAAPTASARAALLRDVVGNPFRPAAVPALPYAAARLLPWELQSIARAAYEERNYTCPTCKGNKTVPHYSGMYRIGSDPCKTCRSTGTIAGGAIDPARLAVLSDALEEAGACCPRCDSWGIDTIHDEKRGRTDHAACPDCGGTGSHPVVAHLRSPGPHVRGCWAVDLILGES